MSVTLEDVQASVWRKRASVAAASDEHLALSSLEWSSLRTLLGGDASAFCVECLHGPHTAPVRPRVVKDDRLADDQRWQAACVAAWHLIGEAFT